MVRHNNVVPNQHFHKISWQNRVKTWFEQPMRKKRRRAARMKKAAAIAPRPVSGLLRPVVKPPTVRYNYKLREGRGFTLTELKEAGINRKEARSIGIAVDHRRRNKSNESLQLNSQRLKEYKSRLIVFPRKRGKTKAGDAESADLDKAQQLTGDIIPVPSAFQKPKAMAITDAMKARAAPLSLLPPTPSHPPPRPAPSCPPPHPAPRSPLDAGGGRLPQGADGPRRHAPLRHAPEEPPGEGGQGELSGWLAVVGRGWAAGGAGFRRSITESYFTGNYLN